MSRSMVEINAKDYITYTQTPPQVFPHRINHQMHHALNNALRAAWASGVQEITLNGVQGQRYLGTDLQTTELKITINGTPGNDLAFAMNGPSIIVNGNAQDGTGNTMNEGLIVIHGQAGDVTGLSARGGEIYVRDDIGYRAGIHMKEYGNKRPVLVVGGIAQDFAGEYMAGGVFIILGLNLPKDKKHQAHFIGTGMHGGVIYVRGSFEESQLGPEVGVVDPTDEDRQVIKKYVENYVNFFGGNFEEIMSKPFKKLYPKYLRPYGRLYC